MARGLLVALAVALAAAATGCGSGGNEGLQPLRPLESNPRYFTDGSGRAVYLTGFHTWSNLVERGETLPPAAFDYDRYLRRLVRYGHNFIRLWAWELPEYQTSGTTFHTAPQPWLRTGPGNALDGRPRFDLTRPNPRYFERLRTRVEKAARDRIYVSVMLFEGWEASSAEEPLVWRAHPFAAGNNVNGVSADANGDGRGLEYFTLDDPEIVELQRAYVRRVIDAVSDLPNVLFEIANEADPDSLPWQHVMLRFVRSELEHRDDPRPVGITYALGGDSVPLYESGADWVSPGGGGYSSELPQADPRKVSILDTDHVCGVCGDAGLVWKGFTRGYNVIFMDNLADVPAFEEARVAMGRARRIADRLGLATLEPRKDLASTGYCLAGDSRYVVYQPHSGSFAVSLPAERRRYSARWLRVEDGKTWQRDREAAGTTSFTPPFEGEAVLVLEAA